MKRDILIRIAVVSIFMLMIIVSLLIVEHYKKQTKYEYYDLDGNCGETYYCESKKEIKCKIYGKLVEVSQFSEI